MDYNETVKSQHNEQLIDGERVTHTIIGFIRHLKHRKLENIFLCTLLNKYT